MNPEKSGGQVALTLLFCLGGAVSSSAFGLLVATQWVAEEAVFPLTAVLSASLAVGILLARQWRRGNLGVWLTTIGVATSLGLVVAVLCKSEFSLWSTSLGVFGGALVENATSRRVEGASERGARYAGGIAGYLIALGLTYGTSVILLGSLMGGYQFETLFDPFLWDSLAEGVSLSLVIHLGSALLTSLGAAAVWKTHRWLLRLDSPSKVSMLSSVGGLLLSIGLVAVVTMSMLDNRRLVRTSIEVQAPSVEAQLILNENRMEPCIQITNYGTYPLTIERGQYMISPNIMRCVSASPDKAIRYDFSKVLHLPFGQERMILRPGESWEEGLGEHVDLIFDDLWAWEQEMGLAHAQPEEHERLNCAQISVSVAFSVRRATLAASAEYGYNTWFSGNSRDVTSFIRELGGLP